MSRFSELIENLKNCYPDAEWLICYDKLPEVDDLRLFDLRINAYERALQKLDDNAWGDFKAKILHLFNQDTASRGKQQFFNQLNEIFAYKFLSNLGCYKIKFLSEQKVRTNKHKTPDLSFEFSGQQGLCEVKTINKSDGRLKLEESGEIWPSDLHSQLQPGFFKKLKYHIDNAHEKFTHYPGSVRNITYFIVHLDDELMAVMYLSKYRRQIVEFLERYYPQDEFFFHFIQFKSTNHFHFPLQGNTL